MKNEPISQEIGEKWVRLNNKIRFLSVVDDEQVIVSVFRYALSQIDGIKFFGFTNSSVALKHFKLNKYQYGLVLSDYKLPEMDGIQLLKQVKLLNPKVRTLLMSAFELEHEVFEECKCVNTFIQKPVDLPELIEIVKIQLSEPWV